MKAINCMTRHMKALVPALLMMAAIGAAAQQNPVPLINNPLVPASVAPGSQSFELSVNGTGFVPGSVVNWNFAPLQTTFVSSAQLVSTVPADIVATPRTAYITVSSPGTGTSSNVVPFQVNRVTSGVGFDSLSNFAAPNAPCSVTADVNQDNKLDVLVCDTAGSQLLVYLGQGDGKFASPLTFSLPPSPGGIFVGDFNNDACLDLIVYFPPGPSVFPGDCKGSFGPSLAVGYDVYGRSFPGDINADGKLDLVVADLVSEKVAVLLGNGDGSFQPPVYSTAGSFLEDVVVADLNGDGSLDVAVGSRSNNVVDILVGDGRGNLQDIGEYATASGLDGLGAADLNADGYVDLVVGTTGVAVSVLLGNGDGTFRQHVDYPAISPSGPVNVADLNGDGTPDVVVGGQSNQAITFLGNGDGSLQPAAYSYQSGTPIQSVLLGDFNDDGRPDMLTTNGGTRFSVTVQVDSVFSPTIARFPKIKVGAKSKYVPVSLSNNGIVAFTVTKVYISQGAGDFAETNNCIGKDILAGSSCTIRVQFEPTKSGPLSGVLNIVTTAGYSAQMISAQGTGVN